MSEEKQENTAQQKTDKASNAAQQPTRDGGGEKPDNTTKADSASASSGQDRKKSGGTSSSRRRRKRRSSRKGRSGSGAAGQGQHTSAQQPKGNAGEKPGDGPKQTGEQSVTPSAPAPEKKPLSTEELRKEEVRRALEKQSEQDRERASQPREPQQPETPPAWPVRGAEGTAAQEQADGKDGGGNPEAPSSHTPDEAQQARLAEITRTVQVSVEQILAGAEQAAAEDFPDSDGGDDQDDTSEDSLTAADRAGDMGRSLVRWLVLVLGAILIIAMVGVGWLYCNASDKDLPQITVTFDGQTVETASYSWHVPVVGNSLKRTYSETFRRDPVEVAEMVDTSSPSLSVSPSGYETMLTVTDENDEEVFSGSLIEYRKFSFPANGSYTAKLVVSTETGSSQNAAITGKQTYLFQFTIGIRPSVRLNTRTVAQGSVASVRVSNLQSDTAPTLSGTLPGTDFVKLGDAWVAFVPVPYDQALGGYVLQVTADGYTENLELSVTAGSFGYSDVSSTRSRVSPYIGEEDYPAEVEALLDTADPELYWTESGFVQPFLRSIDVAMAYGAPEYVGRTRTERSAGIDNGTGRVAENVVVNTRWGDTIISPADGRVLLAGNLGGTAGNTIVIEHGGGVKTIFFGLGSVGVKTGDKVKQGESIGTTVTRTIVEVRVGDVAVEPLTVLRGENAALQVG